MTFSVGARVSFTVYGKVKTGTVAEVGQAIVWVALDDPRARALRWFHPESLTLLSQKSDSVRREAKTGR